VPYISIEVDLDDYDALSEYSISDIVNWFGAEELLDEIGKKKAADYFELVEYEDQEV